MMIQPSASLLLPFLLCLSGASTDAAARSEGGRSSLGSIPFHVATAATRGGGSHVVTTTATAAAGGANNDDDETKEQHPYEILREKVLFRRWRTITSRLVRFPDGREVDFDVVGQAGGGGGADRAVLIFAWNSQTKTATMIREYMPGGNALKYGIAAGLVEHHKHGTPGSDDDPKLTAAKCELEEECHLVGGTWMQLTDDTLMDKYATTLVTVYLTMDPEQAVNPKALDDEEEIAIVPNVTVPEIWNMIAKGEMNAIGGWACMVAIQKLRELGEL